MLALVISACLIETPASCRDFRMPLTDEMNARQCAMSAMPMLPQWADQHPRWGIAKWKCDTMQVADL